MALYGLKLRRQEQVTIMEADFIKANSSNLPKIDVVMLSVFFASNNFCSTEFCNDKTSISSSQTSYGDDAISFVQLKRDGKLCVIKCKICPEYKVHANVYAVTLTVDEEDGVICSFECHGCVAPQGCCKHAMAFIMWIHRRSEEPSSSFTECYWRKSKLSQIRTNPKYMTVKHMFKSSPSLPSDPSVLVEFLEEAKKRKLNCKLLKYYEPNSSFHNPENV
ncbi:uncharacterized protein LOC119189703 [Manduca sexta]|uniref:uncharacterized protein LOC119189703 n=1 Tax=Manduca sexta TaxID=7130 RepID=UPI00188F6638|nr:uncharacterized protein LOC119189703 [Manduca sexta]